MSALSNAWAFINNNGAISILFMDFVHWAARNYHMALVFVGGWLCRPCFARVRAWWKGHP